MQRRCFICDSDQGARVADIKIDVCGLGNVTYAIRCCAGCGLVLQDPAVPPDLMARHYTHFAPYNAFTNTEPPLSGTSLRMLTMITEQGLSPGHVFDVGAATGGMLLHFRRAGWQVEGSDLSPEAIRQAHDFYGIELALGGCEEVLADKRNLDLITLSHVLEHMYTPRSALAAIHTALAPNGHFLLETPCLAEPERCAPGMFSMEHVNHFERITMTRLLHATGFAPVSIEIGGDNPLYPVITVLARKLEHSQTDAGNAFDSNMAFCKTYTARDEALWLNAQAHLHTVISPREPVYIWSAGIQTSQLLARTDILQYAQIRGLTDRDPRKQGLAIEGVSILSPDEVITAPHRILIGSYSFAQNIEADLRARGVSPQRIIQIYQP